MLEKYIGKILNWKSQHYMTNFSLQLGNIFESNWGYGAIHPGTFPTDWVKLSGIEKDRYCKTVPTMLSSMNVLESGELKKNED